MEGKKIKDVTGIPEMPHDCNVEESLLGLCLLYPYAFHQIQENVSEDDFYEIKNQELFRCIKSVAERGDEISIISISLEVNKRGIKEWDPYTISTLSENSRSKDVMYCANVLNSFRKKRVSWQILQDAASKTLCLDTDTDSLIESVRKDLDDVNSVGKAHISSFDETIKDVIKVTEDNQNPQTKHSGTLTGFDYFDGKGGFQPTDLIIVAAESSQGKTSFATSIVKYAASCGNRIAFYSMEMTKTQLTARLLAMESGISSNAILYDKLLPFELEETKVAGRRLYQFCGKNIYFDDRSTSNADSIISSIRTMSIKYGIKGAVVDYLQILNTNMKSANKEQQMGEVARRLKNLAKELNIWIVALSQLSRDRDNPEPSINRLRDSGQINEAADVTILIYRPEAIVPYSSTRTFPEPFKEFDTKGAAMVTIAKGRNIGTGSFLCGFDSKTTKFYPKEVNKFVGSSNPF